jgi:hypothetical protein
LTRTDAVLFGGCSTSNPTTLSGIPAGSQLSFVRSGYLADGYCYSGSIAVTVTCQDRSGDTITSTAPVTIPQFRISLLSGSGNVFANPTTRQLSFGNFSC